MISILSTLHPASRLLSNTSLRTCTIDGRKGSKRPSLSRTPGECFCYGILEKLIFSDNTDVLNAVGSANQIGGNLIVVAIGTADQSILKQLSGNVVYSKNMTLDIIDQVRNGNSDKTQLSWNPGEQSALLSIHTISNPDNFNSRSYKCSNHSVNFYSDSHHNSCRHNSDPSYNNSITWSMSGLQSKNVECLVVTGSIRNGGWLNFSIAFMLSTSDFS